MRISNVNIANDGGSDVFMECWHSLSPHYFLHLMMNFSDLTPDSKADRLVLISDRM